MLVENRSDQLLVRIDFGGKEPQAPEALEPWLIVERFFRNFQFASFFWVEAHGEYRKAVEEWCACMKDRVFFDDDESPEAEAALQAPRYTYQAAPWAVPNVGLQLWLSALIDPKVKVGIEDQFGALVVNIPTPPRSVRMSGDKLPFDSHRYEHKIVTDDSIWGRTQPDHKLPFEFHEVILGLRSVPLEDLRALPLTSQWWTVTEPEAQLGLERHWEHEKEVWKHLLFMLHSAHTSLSSEPEEPEDEGDADPEDEPEDGVVDGS